MVQRTSQFRNLKQVHGTTQEFVSGTFRGCKFQFCLLAKYFISVNSDSCSHINFHQTVMNWYVFAMPWIILGEKQLIFQVWEVANHWNARVKRCMKKLGSLPSRTDEISLLYVSPKSNCLTQMAQNSRLWCQRELWIETLQRFFVAEAFNTTHCHIVRCQRRESRFWKAFQTFQSSLAKGRWRGSQKRPLVWELESHYLGFLQKSTIPWDLGDVSFWVPYIYARPLSWQFAAYGFPAPGLRKLSWHIPEVPVHEETFQDKTGAIAMVTLRGQDGPAIPMISNDGMYSNKMTVLSSHVQVIWSVSSKTWKQLHRMIVCLKFFDEHQIFRNAPHAKRIGCSTMAVL